MDLLLAKRDPKRHVARDPVRFVHRFRSAADREVVGLIASSLAFGRVASIGKSIERVLAVLGSIDESPARAINDHRSVARGLDGFVHRVYRGEHVARMLRNASRLRAAHGSLGGYLATALDEHGAFKPALADFTRELRGEGAVPRGLAHLLPDPHKGSACKRLLLYCRWMVRSDDGVDVGGWDIAPSVLVMPVDTHIHRIAKNLGLTTRGDASWRTAAEITERLAHFDPSDPVKYDFALCHLGISRDCPSRVDSTKCAPCVLRSVCVHHRVGRPVG